MSSQQRMSLVGGITLMVIGACFLALRISPALSAWVNARFAWPFFVIGAGLILFFIGLLAGLPGMAVPASIVTGIGGLLYWQNATGNWESWAYAWTLIPGFVGVGVILVGLLGRHPRQSWREGLGMIVVSLVLFGIFSSFLGGSLSLGRYWPALLILLGLWILFRSSLRRRN